MAAASLVFHKHLVRRSRRARLSDILLCVLGMFQQNDARGAGMHGELLTRARVAYALHARHIASSGSYVVIIIHGAS